MKRIIATICIGMMFMQSSLPVRAEETYEGKIVTLEKQEGEVTIENSANRELTLRDGSKLYNGYDVYTEDGYAWVVLDDNGVLKMDLDTEVKIEKTENKLEVVLEEGEVFFNIDKQFAEDEKFTIRTSTMTTGIRGTAGIVSTRTIENTGTEFSIKLLEGDVELKYLVEKATDMQFAEELSAGQIFGLHTPRAEKSDTYISTLTDITAADIDGFVAVEIKKSKQLQDKILAQNSVIDEEMLAEIINGADDQLKADELERKDVRNAYNGTVKKNSEILYILANPIEKPVVKEAKPEQEPVPVLSSPVVKPSEAPSLTENLPDIGTSNPDNTNGNENTGNTDGTDNSTDDTIVEPDDTVVKPVVDITITYYWADGTTVFATQAATDAAAPIKPILQPTETGSWTIDGVVYDFTEVLEADTEMIWQE